MAKPALKSPNEKHISTSYVERQNLSMRIHKTLRVTPAMAAGLTDKLMGFEDLIALIDAAAPKPGRPKTYRKRGTAS